MSEADDLLSAELRKLPQKPSDKAPQKDKKRYSELMSATAARALGEALRRKGLKGTLPLATEVSDAQRIDIVVEEVDTLGNGNEEDAGGEETAQEE